MTWVRRYPFTISLLAAVSAATGLAHFFPGSLPSDWSANYGFAPKHFASGDLLRLVTSVFLTHDGLHFGLAMTMLTFIVPWTERTFGSLNALVVFVLSHLTSMLTFALVVGVMQWIDISQTIAALYDFHDVGPSAGYYGCLGASLSALKWSYKPSMILGVLAILTLRILFSANTMPESYALLSADIVHLFAMLAGMAIELTWLSVKRTNSQMRQ